METIINEEKAREIMNKFYGNLMPHYTHNEVFNRCFRARYADILEAMRWKDEQHAQERQQLIDEACEWIKDNVNSYLDWYDWGRCRVSKDELIDDLRKSMKGE